MDPAYGYLVIQTGNSVGDIAAYNCFPCFELVGATTLTCQNDGLWSDPPPTCQMIGMRISSGIMITQAVTKINYVSRCLMLKLCLMVFRSLPYAKVRES